MSAISGNDMRSLDGEPEPFGWSKSRVDDAEVISLAGELDLATAAELRQRLMSAVELSAAATVALDLSAVSFIDARSVGVIFEARAAAARRGRQLRIAGLRGTPQLVFDLLGLSPPDGPEAFR